MIIKNHQISSKFFFAAINTGLALDGNPTDDLIDFHKLRANTYTGISYIGNVAIDIEKVTNRNTLFINSKMSNYARLADVIKKKGSIPGAQIACFKSKFEPQRIWRNTKPEEYFNLIITEIKTLSYHEVKTIIKSFQNGIRKLYEMGFSAIQLHGAHGYLLNSFLSSSFNKRLDDFGKDRTLIIKEILDGIENIISDIVIDLRVSVFEEKIEDELSNKNIDFLNDVYSIKGLDIISFSNGIYNLNKKLIYPNRSMSDSFMIKPLLSYMNERVDRIWNISGNVRKLSELSGHEKHITFSIGRPIIADHDFLIKHFENREEEITECTFKNKCHYFSTKKDIIECGVNKHLF